jgi:hypothetical protein
VKKTGAIAREHLLGIESSADGEIDRQQSCDPDVDS